MSFTRETYYSALFALLATLAPGTVLTCDRRVRLMERMQPAELPALFMAVGNQKTVPSLKQPPAHFLTAHVFLYCANPDQHVSADMALNALVDALQAALAPAPPFATQTLGGLVHHCWIDGESEFFPSPNGERAAAIVPIEMLVFE
jgi:hypothetical protein